MTEKFDHIFGGWKKAEARRWINPDGSEGGIVAVDARLHPDLIIPVDSIVWPGVSIGRNASIGNDASIGDGASIGNNASIGDGVSIGDGASIGNNASIGDGVSIGYDVRIGNGVSIGYDVRIGNDASIGDGVSIGDDVRIGDGASIEKDDWWLSGGPCGSRDTMWTVVYSHEHGLRWWIGCQHGITTEYFRERIDSEHGNNHHADDYRAVIAFVESHPGLARARAVAEKIPSK